MRCRLSLMFLLVLAPLVVPLCSAIAAEEQQAAIGDINALLKAAEEGGLKTVPALVGKGGVNAEDEKAARALSRVIAAGHVEIVKCLIDCGAVVNHAGKYKYPPLLGLAWAEHDRLSLFDDDDHGSTTTRWPALNLKFPTKWKRWKHEC